MKSVYVISNRSYDNPVVAVTTNIKKLKAILDCHMKSEHAPTYAQLCKDFSERKDYSSLYYGYFNDEECLDCFDVTFTDLANI